MEAIVANLRKSFNTNLTKSKQWRVAQLNALMRLVDENATEMCDALKKDLNKHEHETTVMEFGVLKNSIVYALNNIDKWMKPAKVSPIIQLRPLYSTYIESQPLGVVLIIGAWNYPYQVSLVPLVGAIAAGNCVVVKPSEISQHSAALLEKLWPRYFDSNFIALINGGVQETSDLLKQRFDYIFYTGSTNIGKIIMKAAAEHMTPLTLECGGKSPCYIDKTADMNVTAKRLMWSKFANNGQTCIAPDFILCTKQVEQELIPRFKNYLTEFYGKNPKDSNSYGRIINERHFKRLSNLIDKSKVVIGGEMDESNLYISPTVMTNVVSSDNVMQEEIFGPILPIVTVNDQEQAIEFINQREKPLTLYVFSNDDQVFKAFRERTSSGSFGFNECLMQAALECLPFGGVGASGMGKYHGKYSFETFSHQRAVLKGGFFGDSLSGFRYPPYNKSKTSQAIMGTCEIRENLMTRTLFNPYVFIAFAAILAFFFTR